MVSGMQTLTSEIIEFESLVLTSQLQTIDVTAFNVRMCKRSIPNVRRLQTLTSGEFYEAMVPGITRGSRPWCGIPPPPPPANHCIPNLTKLMS